MAENSKIEWTDHTVNFWWGCAKVSPACAHCYAEGQAARFYPGHWGPDAPRRLRVEAAAREARRYEIQAVAMGRRFRVFTNSMADFWEDRRDLDAARVVALETMFHTPHLDWLILTKRPEAIIALLKRAERDTDSTGCSDWIRRWLGWGQDRPEPPANIWLGTTVEDHQRLSERLPALVRVPARVRFLSIEPMLGPVDLLGMERPAYFHQQPYGWHAWLAQRLHWVICGGESGPHARPMNQDWARGLRDQCAAAGIPFLFKQWGEWLPDSQNPKIPGPSGATQATRVGKHSAGRTLDGTLHNAYPCDR